jgi:hypothetical protein
MEKDARMTNQHRSFEDARKFVHTLKLKNRAQWHEYCKSTDKPKDIPYSPEKVYKNKGWISVGDWLGTGYVAARYRTYRSFDDAREFARGLGMRGKGEWHEYSKSNSKPSDIPTNPNVIYKNKGWIGYVDFLGSENISPKERQYRSFDDAREFARGLGLSSSTGWHEYCTSSNKPNDIPSNPNLNYKNKGWNGYGDFLGTGNIASQNISYRSFDDAREFARGLGLKSMTEWRIYSKSGNKPDDIPADVQQTYQTKGWITVGDFLGNDNIATQEIPQNYLPWPEAKLLYRKIAKENNLKNLKDWSRYAKTHKLPKGLPANLAYAYTKERVWKMMNK